METEDTVTGQQTASSAEESDPESRLIEACQRLTRLLAPLNVPDLPADTPLATSDTASANRD